MDVHQALADLIEISSQIEAAAIVDAGGTVLASTVADPARAGVLGALAAQLRDRADATAAGRDVVQLEAATDDGSVFLVRDGGRTIVAATRPQPTVGLVFYDLKSALRAAAGPARSTA